MNILFWNLKRNSNIEVIQELITENNVDYAVFAEYDADGIKKIVDQQKGNYVWHNGNGGCDKITMLAKADKKVLVRREQDRYTLYSCDEDDQKYIIVGVHLHDRRSYPQNTIRVTTAVRIVEDVELLEKEMNTDRSIIVGDFNENPFDITMISKSSFNSVIFKSIIEKQETIQHNNKKRKRFFNPILQYLKDVNGKQGSYYYTNGDEPLYWNCFDQVLFRKSLLSSYRSMEYCTKTSKKKLLANIAPSQVYSDHLPLLVKFSGGKQNG